MNYLIGFISLFLCLSASSQDLIIRNISIIDVASDKIHERQNILISGNRISRISSNPINLQNAVILNGEGKFVIPGLWDMHTHLYHERDLKLLVINGVTGTRIMAGDTTTLKWKKLVEKGKLFGPKIFTAGETFESWPEEKYRHLILSLDGFEVVTTRAEARKAVQRHKKAGYDFIKIYNNLRDSIVEVIFDESARQNMVVCGHVPLETGLKKCIQLGIRSVEHLRGYIFDVVSDSSPIKPSVDFRSRTLAWNYIDSLKQNQLIETTVKGNVWNCPTFSFELVLAPQADVDAYLSSPEAGYMLPAGYKYYSERSKIPYISNFSPLDFQQTVTSLENRFRFVKKLHEKGGLILAGTDTEVYGFSLHRELKNLADCGLTNYAVLKTATLNPALYFNIEKDYGTVEAGKIADLVILDKNPVADISATQSIYAVIRNGIILSREKLEKMKAELKQR